MWSALLGLSIALLLLGLTARNLQPRLTKGLVKQVMDLQDALRDVLIKNSIYKNNLDISMERVTELEKQLEEKCNKCPNRRKK